MIGRKDAIAAEFYQRYIQLAPGETPTEALRRNTRDFRHLLSKISGKKSNHAYAEGKWTIRQLLQHIIDAERVFVYRALSFSRKDGNHLPSFDENSWAAHAHTETRTWGDLKKEFKFLRRATELMFASFTDDQLLATGTASNNPVNVVALGLIAAGHAQHHLNIIKERYLN